MDINTLTDKLSVSGQIAANDLAILKQNGVTTIINNRPDDEACEQPRSDALAAQAEKLGLAYYFIPVTPGHLLDADAVHMSKILNESAGKVHAFCRSGNRSSLLWQRSQDLLRQTRIERC